MILVVAGLKEPLGGFPEEELYRFPEVIYVWIDGLRDGWKEG